MRFPHPHPSLRHAPHTDALTDLASMAVTSSVHVIGWPGAIGEDGNGG